MYENGIMRPVGMIQRTGVGRMKENNGQGGFN
jgi:hypothetical protein